MRVLTFGEILLRLAAPGYTRLFQRDYLETSFCGGEANVAVALSTLGVESEFSTVIPDNEIAKAAINSLKYFGVNTEKVMYGEGRMGTYYLEKGASQRPSKVIYDRAYSAISMVRAECINWESICEGVSWFHCTGITPALSEQMEIAVLDACKKAREAGITISCDLNYRGKLWSSDKAMGVMKKIMPYVDVCIANEEDIEKVLGIKIEKNDINSGVLNKEGYEDAAREICCKFGCKYVATTLRESYSASVNGWSGMLYSKEDDMACFSKDYTIHLVDRVGGGDSFAAGVIYALLSNKRQQDAIDFAVAASCLKQTMEGDFNRASLSEIEKLVNSKGSGRVER